MKKLSLGKLRLQAENVIERSQLAMIYGGSGSNYTFYHCRCGGGSQFTLMSNGNPLSDAGCNNNESVSCVVAN